MLKHLAWIFLTGAAVVGTLLLFGVGLSTHTVPPVDPMPINHPLDYTAEMWAKNAIPASTSTGHGAAFLYLYRNNDGGAEGNIQLRYGQLVSRDTGIQIHGPASSQEVAPLLKKLPPGEANARVSFSKEEMDMLEDGTMYVVVTSEKYPDGEIRGQFKYSSGPLHPY